MGSRPTATADGIGVNLALQAGLLVAVTTGVPTVGLVGGWAAVVATTTAALATSLMAWLWLTSPLERALAAMNRYADGERSARAPVDGGLRSVRGFAVQLNRCIDRMERLAASRPDARPALDAVVEGIRALCEGRPWTDAGRLSGMFEPARRALEAAREDLRGRSTNLHRTAGAIAHAAAAIAPSVRVWTHSVREQREALDRLTEHADGARQGMERARPQLEAAVEMVSRAGAEQRRLVGEVRDRLLDSSRSAAEASDALERSRRLVEEGTKLDRALRVLARTSPEASAIGEANAAQAMLQRELARLVEDLTRLSASLHVMANSQPTLTTDLDTRTTEPVTELADMLVGALELSVGTIRTVTRTAQRIEVAVGAAKDQITVAAEQWPKLATAIIEVGEDGTFDRRLLEVLSEARSEMARVGPDGLTDEGRSMLAAVDASADAAQRRLAALVRTTEAASSILRLG